MLYPHPSAGFILSRQMMFALNEFKPKKKNKFVKSKQQKEEEQRAKEERDKDPEAYDERERAARVQEDTVDPWFDLAKLVHDHQDTEGLKDMKLVAEERLCFKEGPGCAVFPGKVNSLAFQYFRKKSTI